MLLTDAQLEEFDREGYLFLPSCFSKEEMALLASEAEGIYAEDRKEVWRESSGAPRTAFAAHTYNEAYRRASCFLHQNFQKSHSLRTEGNFKSKRNRNWHL